MNPLKPWWLRLLPYLGVVIAVASVAAWIDHRGFERAETRAKLDNANAAIRARDLQRTVTAAITIAVGKIDINTADQIAQIKTVNRTIIQPEIQKEIIRDARLRDPDAGIGDVLFSAINRARRLSRRSPAPGELEIDLPAADPVERQDNRDAGP